VSDRTVGGYLLRAREAEVLQSPLLLQARVAHGFSTRNGGVSRGSFASLNFGLKGGDDPDRVRLNAQRLGTCVGFDAARLFRVRQVHGDRVVQISVGQGPADVQQQEADALVTAHQGTAVGVATADCVPVLLAQPGGRVVGAAHAGWRGIVAGVLPAVVRRLRGMIDPGASERLLAAVGPCIGPCCYEVGADVARQFARMPGVVIPGSPRPHLDLVRAAQQSLLEAGLTPEQISVPVGLCTRCQRDLFFSYRRDGDATGHHLSVVLASP